MNLLDANDRPGTYPESWYAATADPPAPRPALSGAHRADVCIIGGGYTGLSAALDLAEAGYEVVVLEAQRVGFGASGRNGGQVGSGQRRPQQDLEAMVGAHDARALWDLGEAAKARVKSLIARHDIDCDWRDGIVHAVWQKSELRQAEDDIAHLAGKYGYTHAHPLDRDSIQSIVRAPGYLGGAVDWDAGHLHPLRYALGLARAAETAGATICENTRVTSVTPGARVRVDCGDAHVSARHVILACNGYLGGLDLDIAARVMPINNFIVATEPLRDPASVLTQPVAVADSRFVVNYFRLSADNRLLFGGGESYGYRFPKDIPALVRRPMEATFPQLKGVPITHAWGGTLAITRSRMPCFFSPASGVLSASGYSGHGVAMATLAGAILAETIRGQSERFDLMARLPMTRFPGGPRLRPPLLALAMLWYVLRDRLGL